MSYNPFIIHPPSLRGTIIQPQSWLNPNVAYAYACVRKLCVFMRTHMLACASMCVRMRTQSLRINTQALRTHMLARAYAQIFCFFPTILLSSF